MSYKLGIKCKLYYNTGTFASPTWSEIKLVADLNLGPTWDEADASTRLSRVKQTAKTLLDLELTGRIRVDDSDVAYLAVLAASIDDTTPLDIMALTGAQDEDNNRGYRFESNIMRMGQDQALGAVAFDEFSIKPAPSLNAPQSVLVTTGAPVFTDIVP